MSKESGHMDNIQYSTKPELKCLSEIFRAHGDTTKEMVTEQSSRDNSWFQQPAFNSSLIKTKIPNRRRAGYRMESLNQGYFKLPENFHCRLSELSELYQGGLFLSEHALQVLVRNRTDNQDWNITGNTHILLKSALKYAITGE